MEFAGTDANLLEDQWRDYVKANFKAKLKRDRKSDELTATELKSAMMGSDQFAIYSTIEKSDKGSALNVWVDAGAYFLNRRDNQSHTSEFSNSLKAFYYDVRRATINQELKVQQDKLKDLDNRQKKLQKENDGLHKDIDSYKSKIKKAEDDIVKNEKEQDAVLRDNEAQKRLIEEVKRRLANVENERN
jgi:septal ring factor EnvC (AmiA/AmiB activator)